jgi:hypothetical protein
MKKKVRGMGIIDTDNGGNLKKEKKPGTFSRENCSRNCKN